MEEINLKDFFQSILKKIWLILLTGAMFAISVLAYDKVIKVPLYQANATLVLTKTNNQEKSINQNDIQMNQKLVYTYSELVKSKRVLKQVIKNKKLKEKYSELSKYITVTNIENTEILKISAKYKDAKIAKDIANEIAYVFSKEIVEIYDINNVSIIDWATIPKNVCNNTTSRDVVVGFLAGSFIVIAILLVIYYFDDTIKYSENLEDIIKMPIIGKIMKKKEKVTNELIVDENPKDLISEAIKSVRTNLSFSEVDSELKTILMTSTVASEGKSFVSANLATAFAQTGKKVLLVDCDMRKGRQHKIFKLANDKGFSDLLVDNINKYSNYVKSTSVRRLYVLPCGTIPPNPSELLNSGKNRKLIELLKENYDLIIFDGVPCNGLPDSIIMSTIVDKTIIVSSEGITPRELLNNIKKDLDSVNANIAGVILNKVNMGSSKYYNKYYSYYGEIKK